MLLKRFHSAVCLSGSVAVLLLMCAGRVCSLLEVGAKGADKGCCPFDSATGEQGSSNEFEIAFDLCWDCSVTRVSNRL